MSTLVYDHLFCLCVFGRWRAFNYSGFWGLTLDQGIRYRLGTFRPTQPVNKMTSMRVFAEDQLPESFDARDQWAGLIEDVLDQGNCAASWAFSTTGQRPSVAFLSKSGIEIGRNFPPLSGSGPPLLKSSFPLHFELFPSSIGEIC